MLALLRLPVTLYKLVQFILNSDGTVNLDFQRGVLPPGTYEFSAAELPLDGSRLKCDGSAVSRTTYAALFAAIGEVYGAGDMATTFNLPDFRDRFPVGQSATKIAGATGGEATHKLTDAEMGGALSHLHTTGRFSQAANDDGYFLVGTPPATSDGNGRIITGNSGAATYGDISGATGDYCITSIPSSVDSETVDGLLRSKNEISKLPPWMATFVYIRC